MIDKMCHMDYAEDMMCVVERRNPNNVVTLSHGFPGYHDLCNIVTISATCHIMLLFSREFGDDCTPTFICFDGEDRKMAAGRQLQEDIDRCE